MLRDFNNNIRNKENLANYCIQNRINLFSNNRQDPNDDKNVLINNNLNFYKNIWLNKDIHCIILKEILIKKIK